MRVSQQARSSLLAGCGCAPPSSHPFSLAGITWETVSPVASGRAPREAEDVQCLSLWEGRERQGGNLSVQG